MQALSEDDRKLWMEAMDGLEPVGDLKERHCTPPPPSPSGLLTAVDTSSSWRRPSCS